MVQLKERRCGILIEQKTTTRNVIRCCSCFEVRSCVGLMLSIAPSLMSFDT